MHAIRAVIEREGRFRILDVLGEGGMGVVCRVFDEERGEEVALKTLKRDDPTALYRLKEEFRSLSELRHPNLASLYELHQIEGTWFFTMELVRGENFLSWIHDGSRRGDHLEEDAASDEATTIDQGALADGATATLDSERLFERKSTDGQIRALGANLRATTPRTHPGPEAWDELVRRTRQAMRQLVSGVEFLHRHGKMHRDLKPPNVLVTERGRVVLLDFGLVTNVTVDLLQRSSIEGMAGTVPYMAPEQTREEVSPASDWYAVGVMLFEALTGVRPFDGPAVRVLVQKNQEDAPRVAELEPRVPADLAGACRALLDRKPEVRAGGIDCLRRADRDDMEERHFGELGDVFVGREQELRELSRVVAKTRQGASTVVSIRGASGVGKSALVRNFLSQLQDDILVLGGKCYERDSVPFKALDPIVDTLAHHLVTSNDDADHLLPDDVAPLGRMFPVLRRVPEIDACCREAPETTDSRSARRRAFIGFRHLFAELARTRPVVVAIDDAQWGDPDSAALLLQLMDAPPPERICLLFGLRTPEAEGSELERVLDEMRSRDDLHAETLQLEPLDADDSRRLVAELVGAADERLDAVADQVGGSPFLLREMARIWTSKDADDDGEATPVDARQLLGRRLARLDSKRRELLELVSIATGPLEERLLSQMTKSEDARTDLASLAAAQLVRVRPVRGGDAVETFHDRIREFIASELSEARRVSLHARVGETLEAEGSPRFEALAHHFRHAGASRKAARFALRAAERAEEKLAFGRAAEFYAEALACGDFSPAEASEWRERRAECLVNAGYVREAATNFVEAAQAAVGRRRVDLLRRSSEQYLIGGYVEEGSAVLEEVSRAISIHPISNRLLLLMAILFWRFRVHWTLRRSGLEFEPADDPDDEDLLRIDACNAVATGHGLVDLAQSALFQHRGTHHALRHGDTYRLVRAILGEAAYSSTGGVANAERTRELLDAAQDVLEGRDCPEGEIIVQGEEIMVAANEGRWRDALELTGPTLQRLQNECTGLNWEVMAARLFRLWSRVQLGQFHVLGEEARELIDDARARGDRQAETLFSMGPAQFVWLTDGALREARERRRRALDAWTPQGYHLQHAYALLSGVNIELIGGDARAAWKVANDGWPDLRRSLLMYHRQFSLLISSVLARSAVFFMWSEGKDRSVKRQLKGWMRRLDRTEEEYATGYADVLRAEMAVCDGRIDDARGLLESALRHLDERHQVIDHLAVRLGLEMLDGELGDAYEKMREVGVRSPTQFTRLYLPVIASI